MVDPKLANFVLPEPSGQSDQDVIQAAIDAAYASVQPGEIELVGGSAAVTDDRALASELDLGAGVVNEDGPTSTTH